MCNADHCTTDRELASYVCFLFITHLQRICLGHVGISPPLRLFLFWHRLTCLFFFIREAINRGILPGSRR
ncbi:hypothetical protein B0F90DRAFT_1769411 [Multifurca ochricompacta]|uniref:Uncharacterized protein n=1 Tax=Multifurca ochricompacta TaxID=376703 RepID=A0AAD4LW86_9AGAM|nr:hypothetical protein B0F90DRAFT_1769411 [Multifurca ochricompacta]